MRKQLRAIFFRGIWLPALLFVLSQTAAPQSPAGETVDSRLSNGINLYSQGKWQEAVLELRRVQAGSPSAGLRGESLFWISLAELSAGEYQEALRDMDTLQETDPVNPRLKDMPYHRGRALYYLGRFDEAIIFLQQYADSLMPRPGSVPGANDNSRRAAALYWTGECLFSLGQLEKAGDVFRLITEEYRTSPKYEASVYRLALINQKKVENELLGLLKWSHEESLRNMEEYRQRESAYDQALNSYQKRIAEMSKDTRLEDLENSNARYREQIESAEERIRSLENTLRETSEALEKARASGSAERLKAMQNSARELENRMQVPDRNSREYQ